MFESTTDNLSKFRTRNWVEIYDESRGNYANGDIKFKTTMLRSNLYDYADSYILVKGTITITGNKVPMLLQNEQMKEIKE